MAPVKKPIFSSPLPVKRGGRPRASWGIGLATALIFSAGAGLAYKFMAPQAVIAADTPAAAPTQVEAPQTPELGTPAIGNFQLPAALPTDAKPRPPKPFVRSESHDPFAAAVPIPQPARNVAREPENLPHWAAGATPVPTTIQSVSRVPVQPGNTAPQVRTAHLQVQPGEQPQSGEAFQAPIRQVQAESKDLFFDLPAQPPEMPAAQMPVQAPQDSVGFSFDAPPSAVPQGLPEPAYAPAPTQGNADWATPTETAAPAVREQDAFVFPEPQPLSEPTVESRPPAAFSMDAQPITRTAATTEVDKIHEVQGGDNYWTISRQHYGSARYFAALAEYNRQRIPQPERMKPGMKVLVPSEDLLNRRYAKLTGYVEKEQLPAGVPEQGFFVDSSGQPMYRIGKNDTLTDIAEAHLGRSSRWIQIFGLNRHQLKDPNSLTMGMILQLPRDASQIVVAP